MAALSGDAGVTLTVSCSLLDSAGASSMIAMSDDGEQGVPAPGPTIRSLGRAERRSRPRAPKLPPQVKFVRRVTDDPESLLPPPLITNLPLHPTHPKQKRQHVVEASILAALREEAVREAGGADADDGEEVD